MTIHWASFALGVYLCGVFWMAVTDYFAKKFYEESSISPWKRTLAHLGWPVALVLMFMAADNDLDRP